MSKKYQELTTEEINQLKVLLENAERDNLDEIEFLGELLTVDYGHLLLIATEFNNEDKKSDT